MYLLLGAEFIAAAQLIVYAGAIMVLFLFVIMLLTGREFDRITLGALIISLGLLVDDAIIVIDETGEILYVNPVAEKVFGSRSKDLLGQNLRLSSLADTRRSQQQHVACLADESAGGQVEDLLLLDRRVEGPVELVQRFHFSKQGRFDAAGDLPHGVGKLLGLVEQAVARRQRRQKHDRAVLRVGEADGAG